jgi:hypothetical protein
MNQAVPSPTNIKLPEAMRYEEKSSEERPAKERIVEWSWVDSEWKIIDQSSLTQPDFLISDPTSSLLSSTTTIKLNPSPSSSIEQSTSPLLLSATPSPQSPEIAGSRRLHNRSVSDHHRSASVHSVDSEILIESLRSSGLGIGVVNGSSSNTNTITTTSWEVDANGTSPYPPSLFLNTFPQKKREKQN